MLQLKEKADDTLSRLSQRKAEAEENLSSLTLMADDLKSLVNKQKCLIESSEEFQERKRQAQKLVDKLQINQLACLRFEPVAPVNGVRPWHSLIPSVMNGLKKCHHMLNDEPGVNAGDFEPVRTSSLASDGAVFHETVHSDINFELSRLSMFSPIDCSPRHNVFSEHDSSDLSKLLTDQLATSALIDASTETIDE